MERKNEYIGFRGRASDIVVLNNLGEWFDFRPGEDELPNVGAFCKKCTRETAFPEMPIFMNGRPAYALKCKQCGSEYAMYKSMFTERYIGYDFGNKGSIAPTHGMKSRFDCMDRKAREDLEKRRKESEENLKEIFHMTDEEYKKMKEEMNKDHARARRAFRDEMCDVERRVAERNIEIQSNNRKELIEKGVLKYIKKVGLVNTETGEVVKL